MKENIIALVIGTVFLMVGIVCLLWSERIQQYTLDYFIHRKIDERLNPFLNWMKTREFVWSLRFTGLVGILGFVLILIGFIKGVTNFWK